MPPSQEPSRLSRNHFYINLSCTTIKSLYNFDMELQTNATTNKLQENLHYLVFPFVIYFDAICSLRISIEFRLLLGPKVVFYFEHFSFLNKMALSAARLSVSDKRSTRALRYIGETILNTHIQIRNIYMYIFRNI